MHAELRDLVLAGCACSDVASLTRALVARVATPSVALARVWLCGRAGDPGLVASAGTPLGGGTYSRVDGTFASLGAGGGKIARIAESRAPLIVRSVRGDEEWIDNPGWIARQGVRGFAGLPLMAGDECHGVLGIFDRAPLTDVVIADLLFIAAFAAARIGELRDRPSVGLGTIARAGSAAALESRDPGSPDTAAQSAAAVAILTRGELRDLERRTIQSALDRCGGRVFGPRGAAALLATKPTTLASRVKALGLKPRVR